LRGRISAHLQAVVLTSRGLHKTPFEKGQSLPQMVAILRLLQTLRDNFLQDFRSNEKSIIDEVCLELGDERTA